MQAGEEITWIPWADRLVLIASLAALRVIAVILIAGPLPLVIRVGRADISSAVIALIGYVFAIFARYRVILAGSRAGERENPEPSEREIV